MKKLLRAAILSALLLSTFAPDALAGWGVAWKFDGAGIASNGSGFNNPPAPEGKQVAFLQNTSSVEQGFTAAADGKFTVSWQAGVRFFPDTNHDYDVMVDGNALVRVDSSKLNAYKYTPMSVAVDLTAGQHTLRFQGVNSKGGDHTSFIDDVHVKAGAVEAALKNPGFDDVVYTDGTYIYNPPVVTTPFARLDARVTTSGKAIFGRLVSTTADAKYLPLVAVATPPVVKVDGRDVGATTTLVNTGDHEGFLLFLGPGAEVKAGQSCTLTAPMAWATVANDFAGPMADQPIDVYTGRSFVGTDAVKPATKIGWCIGAGDWYKTQQLTKNLRPRMEFWFNSAVSGADADGYPTRLSQDTVACTIANISYPNGIDATEYPTPEGLWAVGWGRAPGNTVECSLATSAGVGVERTDLANKGTADGRGLVRVFDFRRKAGAASANFDVVLQVTDPSRAPRFTYLVVYAPGDFKVTDNTPTVLDDVDNPSTPSAAFLARAAGGVGPLRWGNDFISPSNTANACEPEHIQGEKQFSWNGWKGAWTIKYKQLRPWSPATAPYVYSPLFGDPFPATLGTAMNAATAGTTQAVEIPDAATAPVFEGLVIQADGERMRVLSGSGTTWTIERGSESTTPAAHAAGPISVSNRLAMASLADFAPNYRQVIEFVCTTPHQIRTGNHPTFEGDGWGIWPMADGSLSNNGDTLNHYRYGALVTGPDRFLIVANGKSAVNTTLAAAVDLNPDLNYSQIVVPGAFGAPHAVAAKLTAKVGGDLHLNIPYAVSDSYIDAIARITLANFPPGHRIYLEYINEPWNWSYTTTHSQVNWSWMLGKHHGMYWQTRRTGQMTKRFAAVFAEKGRAAEVRSILNQQLYGDTGRVREIVKQALDEGLPPPDIAVAAYVDIGAQPSLVRGMEAAGLDRAVDLWIWNLYYGNSNTSPTTLCKAWRDRVDAANKELGTSIELYMYEGGASLCWPLVTTALSADVAADSATIPVADASRFVTGQLVAVGSEWVKITAVDGNNLTVLRGQSGSVPTARTAGTTVRNAYLESGHDLPYQPNYRVAEFDQFGLWQKYFHRIASNGYSWVWDSGYQQWCIYHWLGQLPGRGDGSDGLADNRKCMATPGLVGTKGPLDNQDYKNVSVRGQAFLEWNRAVDGGVIVTPPPDTTPPPPDIAAQAKAIGVQIDAIDASLGTLRDAVRKLEADATPK